MTRPIMIAPKRLGHSNKNNSTANVPQTSARRKRQEMGWDGDSGRSISANGGLVGAMFHRQATGGRGRRGRGAAAAGAGSGLGARELLSARGEFRKRVRGQLEGMPEAIVDVKKALASGENISREVMLEKANQTERAFVDHAERNTSSSDQAVGYVLRSAKPSRSNFLRSLWTPSPPTFSHDVCRMLNAVLFCTSNALRYSYRHYFTRCPSPLWYTGAPKMYAIVHVRFQYTTIRSWNVSARRDEDESVIRTLMVQPRLLIPSLHIISAQTILPFLTDFLSDWAAPFTLIMRLVEIATYR